MPDEQPDSDERFETEREWLAYLRGRAAGREEARKEAHNKVAMITPQMIRMRTEEGEAWLSAPEQIAVRRAHDVVCFYFDLACVLMRAKGSTKSHTEWAAKQILQCVRSWEIPPEDNAKNRLASFLNGFVSAVHRYKSTRAIWTTDWPDEDLSSDPEIAAEIRRERQHRRDTELLPNLAPNLARQTEHGLLLLYPEERDKVNVGELAKAIEAWGLYDKRPGRKKKGEAGKYALLEAAIKDTSFAVDKVGLESPVRRAFEREKEWRRQVSQNEKSRLDEPWEPATFSGEENNE